MLFLWEVEPFTSMEMGLLALLIVTIHDMYPVFKIHETGCLWTPWRGRGEAPLRLSNRIRPKSCVSKRFDLSAPMRRVADGTRRPTRELSCILRRTNSFLLSSTPTHNQSLACYLKKSKIMFTCNATTSDAFGEILICPITLELPLDPVMAMDGRVYEKAALGKHFRTQMEILGHVKSPLTGQIMRPSIVPATQHKHLIETAIEQGVLTGELVDHWKERVHQQKSNESLLQRAEKGDVQAIQQVSYFYMHGLNGFPRDTVRAFEFAELAHHNGSGMGTALVGFMLVKGIGVREDAGRGIRYLTLAAHRGSAWAACRLGMALADGLYGLDVDEAVAVHWLKVSLNENCSYDDITGNGKSKAREKLYEIMSHS